MNTLQQDLEELYHIVNQYELIDVTKVTQSGQSERFCADGVKWTTENHDSVGFSRTFSSIRLTTGLVHHVLLHDDIRLNVGNDVYIIHTLNKKQEIPLTDLSNSFNLSDLMRKKYIDEDGCNISKGQVYLPLSLKKLGKLTVLQKNLMRKIMNVDMRGGGIQYQCCRVPAFGIDLNEDTYSFYCQIHSIDKNMPLNKVLIRQGSIRENDFQENDLLTYAWKAQYHL